MVRVTFVGHATLLIEMDGQRILTDPLLTRWIGPLRRQQTPVEPEWVRRIDAVLLSHLHYDHFHLPSLALVDPGARLVAPSGSGSYLVSRGLRDVAEVRPGDRFTVGPVEIEVVYADHDPGRPLSGMIAEPQGFILRGSQTVYFAGDTDLFPEMSQLDPSIDIALIPIWGWGPTLGDGHLDPARAAEAMNLIQPRIAIPIHWGTYFPVALPWRRRVALGGAPREFEILTSKVAPEVEVRVVRPGQSTALARVSA